MTMIKSTIFPGRYIQGPGALSILGEETARLGDRGFVICGSTAFDRVWPSVEQGGGPVPLEAVKFGGECTEKEVDRLAQLVGSQGGKPVIVGLGGGKVLDTAKAVAHRMERPVVCAPTIASTDAPCSAVAVLYTPDGSFERYLFLPRNPDLVLVDTGVIVDAPVRFLISGMGDALATWFEAKSCRQKYAKNMSGHTGTMTAYALAELCYNTLQDDGELARSACENHVVTPALERVVEANTLLSGLGFESGGLAAAHAIHNGLTVLKESRGAFHGEKVAIGVLASLFLTDQDAETIETVYDFCEMVALPVMLSDIGLADVSDEDLMIVAEAACKEGETIYNEPVPVTPEMVFWALKAADAEGNRREGMWTEEVWSEE